MRLCWRLGKAIEAVPTDCLRDHFISINRNDRLYNALGTYQTWRTAHADLGQFYHACRWGVAEAKSVMETSEEKWCEAEISRVAGEIAMLSARCGCNESGGVLWARARVSLASSKPSPWNSVPQRASRGSGVTRAR